MRIWPQRQDRRYTLADYNMDEDEGAVLFLEWLYLDPPRSESEGEDIEDGDEGCEEDDKNGEYPSYGNFVTKFGFFQDVFQQVRGETTDGARESSVCASAVRCGRGYRCNAVPGMPI